MDALIGTSLQIVLGVKSGKYFNFLNTPIVVSADLSGYHLESDVAEPSESPIFENELIWEANKSFLKRLRTNNTSIRVECFKVLSKNKRERIGYFLLNLKCAQIIPQKCGGTALVKSFKLSAIKNDAKNYKPELLLSFYISESGFKADSPKDDRDVHENKILENKDPGESLEITTNDFIQIGSMDKDNAIFKISIHITSVANLFIVYGPYDANKQKSLRIQYFIFDTSYYTQDVSEIHGTVNGEITSIILRSSLQKLNAFFHSNNKIPFKLLKGDKIIAASNMDISDLVPTSNWEEFMKNLGKNKEILLKAKLIFEELEETTLKQLCVESIKPFISVMIKLVLISPPDYLDDLNKSNCITDGIENLLDKISVKDISIEENECLKQNPSSVQIQEVLNVEELVVDNDQVTKNCELQPKEIELKKSELDISKEISKNFEDKEIFSNNCTFPEMKQNLHEDEHGKTRHEIVLQICEELEEWKDYQQELYKQELKRKMDIHLAKISEDWLKKQQLAENEYKERTKKCQLLMDSLNQVANDLKQKHEQLMKKEVELNNVQKELDKAFTIKFQELREASLKHQIDMEHKLGETLAERNDYKMKLDISEKERQRLEEEINKELSNNNKLSEEQVASLMRDMKCLEEKLQAALESKAFFKQEWGKAVREVHKLKSDQKELFKLQLEKNKLELQNLNHLTDLSKDEYEMLKDKESLKNIRDEIENIQKLKSNGNIFQFSTLTSNPTSSGDYLPTTSLNNSMEFCNLYS